MQTSRRVARAIGGLLMIGLLAAGCALPPDYTLHVFNHTTLAMTMVVNGQPIAVLEPARDAAFGTDSLPTLPWRVEGRTVSGRVVVTMDVATGSVVDQRNVDGTGSYSAPATRVDLSCGQIRMSVGNLQFSGGPPPVPAFRATASHDGEPVRTGGIAHRHGFMPPRIARSKGSAITRAKASHADLGRLAAHLT